MYIALLVFGFGVYRREGLLPGREFPGALFLRRGDRDEDCGLRSNGAGSLRRAGHGIHRLSVGRARSGRRPLLRASNVRHQRAGLDVRVDQAVPRAQVLPAGQLYLHQRYVISRFNAYLFIKIRSVCPSVCAMVSESIKPLPSDRLRCCDRYIRCQRSLAVKPLTMSGVSLSQGKCGRVSRSQVTMYRRRTAAARCAR